MVPFCPAGASLNTIELAIDHPSPKADHFGTAVSVFGAIVIVLKAVGAAMTGKDWALVLAAAVLGGMQLLRYISALFAKTPNRDAAKAYIADLRTAQGWTPPSETNWQKFRRLMWERIFRTLEYKKEGTPK
jgi:hypothetical protein